MNISGRQRNLVMEKAIITGITIQAKIERTKKQRESGRGRRLLKRQERRRWISSII